MNELQKTSILNETHPYIPSTLASNKSNTNFKSLKCCYEFVDKRKNKKDLETSPPSPILPKVKFEESGDFIKEPLDRNNIFKATFYSYF